MIDTARIILSRLSLLVCFLFLFVWPQVEVEFPSLGGDTSEGSEVDDLGSDVDCMEGLDGEVKKKVTSMLYCCAGHVEVSVKYWFQKTAKEYLSMYLWSQIAKVRINRVRLPILLVVS